LIVDGTALGGFSSAVELLDDSEQQSYGFLSGRIDQLKPAQTARWVQVNFGHREMVEIRILQVSNTEIALIATRGVTSG
jgi:hypothetical protein